MIFNSVTYLLFLPLVALLYWVLPRQPRLWLLFLGSISFYGFWRVEFIPLMLASTLVDYLAGLYIYAHNEPWKRKLGLWFSLLTNLGLLFYFKYLFFVVDNLHDVFSWFGSDFHTPALSIILPLGISFYTFQTISYSVDVYRGFIKPERHFVLYGCFVTFFPQLVAGPVLRAKEVIPQLDVRPSWSMDIFVSGIKRVLLGLFLKVVLADNLAPLVDDGFAQPSATLSAIDVLTLAYLFGFQIYFDFAGYSHIAIGSARMMGITFPENFNFPYIAHSPKTFWKRWHISLSSWIRDYLYFPLARVVVQDRSTGGLAVTTDSLPSRNLYASLFLTWAIMGLWHGAAWTFMVWGLLHAVWIALYRLGHHLFDGWSMPLRHGLGWIITLSLVMLSWIPFRAESLAHTWTLYAHLLQPRDYLWLGMRENTYLIAALLLMGFLISYAVYTVVWPYVLKHGRRVLPLMLESLFLAVVMGLVFIFLRPISQFIYFQF
ncbi:membrane bound O-acyl transferase, MBOAT family protein [Magnetococcus marinus MC-1]|uniref:Probable alginate O-acetylase AlgI n=1 Tax=Magnetococcus marinus (strain ATCC BAA-1437 / JCM 17883 / MC-1) TaxID=156889 RepID=A0LDX0_MAGMM|nr:MBOAT family O-acyltransferase [Magnetococcus marinus]ABK46163.1 membrane bound O-acyl transferase, MBOAT family protein [Magnetococcus marinus MC-1]